MLAERAMGSVLIGPACADRKDAKEGLAVLLGPACRQPFFILLPGCCRSCGVECHNGRQPWSASQWSDFT